MILFIQASAIGVFCGVWGFGGSKKIQAKRRLIVHKNVARFKGLKDWGIALDRQLPYRTVFGRDHAGIIGLCTQNGVWGLRVNV